MGWRQAADLQLEQQHPGLLFSNPIQTPSAFTRAWESRVGSDGFLCILPPHQSPQRNSSLNFPPSLLILGVSQPRFTLSKDTFVPKASINRSSSRETLLSFHRTQSTGEVTKIQTLLKHSPANQGLLQKPELLRSCKGTQAIGKRLPSLQDSCWMCQYFERWVNFSLNKTSSLGSC